MKALKCDEVNSAIKKASELISINEQLHSILNCSDLVAGTKQMTDLVTQIIYIFNNTQAKINFPLQEAMSQRLIQMLKDMKVKHAKMISNIEEVIAKAKGLGYDGDILISAVNYIEKTAIEIESQKGMERMHTELTSVWTIQEKEREQNKKQVEKFKKRLEQSRETISQMQEKMTQREEEVLSEIENEQRKAREAAHECEKEKRIHEELIRLVAGQAVDSDYLQSQLNAKEIQLLKKTEKTRTLIKQMMAKDQEAADIIQKQRSIRKNTLVDHPPDV